MPSPDFVAIYRESFAKEASLGGLGSVIRGAGPTLKSLGGRAGGVLWSGVKNMGSGAVNKVKNFDLPRGAKTLAASTGVLGGAIAVNGLTGINDDDSVMKQIAENLKSKAVWAGAGATRGGIPAATTSLALQTAFELPAIGMKAHEAAKTWQSNQGNAMAEKIMNDRVTDTINQRTMGKTIGVAGAGLLGLGYMGLRDSQAKKKSRLPVEDLA